ncbi:MAG TPA: polysaccharide lyase 6 family protein [Chitinophagaceae bacterium]
MRLLITNIFLLLSLATLAETIPVKNIEELNAANKKAKPGDIIILQNGEWKDVTIKLNCSGTKEQPITFKAQTAGKVLITGHSMLKIGGNYIIVDGLYFQNGYAGDEPVISFRSDKNQLANNCRVTNTAVIDFNNPKRMDENNWVLFYGKNNRLDHCSFKDKKNMGVLLAVVLDDERSRENYHEIDHNYFGRRPPLASNGGEIIRVGVSQHCQYNSNTQIMNNFFEYCDGETEIISIKSCSNMIEDNIFKESEGSLVLRHGDNNIVSGNLFVGNGKPATGGVRVINKGQIVRNNVFYKCRGASFKAPIAVMNGIPNSPANRYVQVTDAEIVDNVFYECSPLSFGEGSDAERTLPPDRVTFANNIFYNTKDPAIFTTSDEINGFSFEKNKVSTAVKQELPAGFAKTKLPVQKLHTGAASDPIFTDIGMIPLALKDANMNTGASWFAKKEVPWVVKTNTVNCATAEEIYNQLDKKEPVIIRLTAKEYSLTQPFMITKKVQFTSDKKNTIRFNTYKQLAVFVVSAKGNLSLNNLSIDGSNTKASHFIASDSSGHSDHFNLSVQNCSLQNFTRENDCQDLFHAFKYMIADSIIIRNNIFLNNNTDAFMMADEKEDKGYYNAEKIVIGHNNFTAQKGQLLNIYRGGNDESTLGPNLSFSHNKVKDCNSGKDPLIQLTGVQVTNLFSNNFINSNPGSILINYRDTVRANHSLDKNTLSQSGSIEKNQFVTGK